MAVLWPEGGNNGLRAEATTWVEAPDAPRIVVDPPMDIKDRDGQPRADDPQQLQVGDTFKQEIYARDFLPPIINDLSAWQMQITYNPEVLQLVIPPDPSEKNPKEGTFLESGGHDALFMAVPAGRGMIKAHQARIGRTTDVTTDAEVRLLLPVPGVDWQWVADDSRI